MRIKNLLLLGAFLATSGGAMAQTTITAGNVKFVPGFDAEMKFNYSNAQDMGGFQMVVSLPDGLTLEEDATKTAAGLSINGGTPATGATFFNVKVPTGFECIGVKADGAGTTSDGTAYKEGDILLVCFPVTAGVKYAAATADKPGELCTLTLKTAETTTADDIAAVKLEGFAGSDTNGTGGEEALAKYATSTPEVTPVDAKNAYAYKCDVTHDGKVNGQDIQNVINISVAGSNDASFDVTGDSKVNGQDIQATINEAVL